MGKIRMGFIGVGDMGSHHALGFDQLDDCEVLYICDMNEGNVARALKELHNSKPVICSDYRELLDKEDLDAVVISVPNYMHRPIAVAFLEAGKHVFLEKPVAHTLEDCDAIIAAAEKHQRILQIGLVYRYSNVYRRLAHEVGMGRLGEVKMMWCKEFRDSFPPADWFYDKTKSGGSIVEKDCHHFDIFNWMIGANPVRVFASGGQHMIKQGQPNLITNSYSHYPAKNIDNPTVVDHAFITIDYDNGSKANLGLCLYLKPMNLMGDGLEIGLIGSNGAQMVVKNDKTIDIAGGENSTRDHLDIDVISDSITGGHTGGQAQRIDFLNCIRSNRQPFASAEVGRNALLIALAAEKSITEERYVYLKELTNHGVS
ncbi:Gfo/Idh/MocA family oxidoreductase [Paenibacillus macerans]|uniref:Gfo/Idh/MocA family oxidoreductase n=1 Tax=Paenibacillus macerans TaxID=44252 RepID=A0A6N8EUC4_PAEMA|nr:Gfo/Idh/MocA family oxidoreductase [Paenibacillus macerans]MBS5911737.1 Gfo/Idh/MocA family oxidoreductase [Paenibacillus macerans]MEC0138906.1 Gfo/Idh/MocA family oxidoreductase [Paenibacillus macerans]MUG23617.1 gfo/Idh/MocA family oxidoreductase [Paenibacillus macerans]UMV45070.1 Gfo/Idh/MocA family oxidoreductase [Paenibacillus macerans]GBK60194.1 gfo/Idh/MocA family oxidoreductase [Paenibacillus macerans]